MSEVISSEPPGKQEWSYTLQQQQVSQPHRVPGHFDFWMIFLTSKVQQFVEVKSSVYYSL